jgi:hypothetical protein|tara:strand:- start:3075 stop:3773 length:699 start_codon:yes stop_codon:yes gene_type:complete
VPTTGKILGATKRRGSTKRNSFELSEARLQKAEKALGSLPDNTALRNELLSAFDQYQGLNSLWQQAPTPGKFLKECDAVLARLNEGANPFTVLNARPPKETSRKHKQNKKQQAVEFDSGISGELLSYLLHRGIDPKSPQSSEVIAALELLRNTPRKKTGRPEEYARDSLLLELAKIYERETGKPATYSSNVGRTTGEFMDLCRAMIIPSSNFMDADGLAIEQAWKRLKKRCS